MNIKLRKLFFDSLYKAVLVTIFFAIVHLLYNIEFIRSNVEDIGFDITNKIVFETREQNTTSPKVMLFGFDDLYMNKEGLFDDENNTNYGYLFPRDKIARFISDLDELCQEVEPQNTPKALFIDYDFSFTSMPYGQELSKEDKTLIDVLKQERPYTVLLPKTETENFIEQSKDKLIQQRIQEEKIFFVSVVFLTSTDGVTRRYLSYKEYENNEETNLYPNVDIALWQFLKNNKIDKKLIQKEFKERDIVANRFFLKSYKNESMEDDCKTSQSYWTNYTKYSAYCSVFEIVEEEFSQAIVMLGGTYNENIDKFDVLDVAGSSEFKGIELHANTLMSIFHIEGQLKQFSFYSNLTVVFLIFFMIDILVSLVFRFRLIENAKLQFIIVLIITVGVMITTSIYLLILHNIWFNWFVSVVIYELFDIILHIKIKIDKYKQRKSNEIVST